jgi:hypothetical protein
MLKAVFTLPARWPEINPLALRVGSKKQLREVQ